ncbi:STAS domain-containing protein [Actinocorallia longicatena]|uniref:Anti-sigma factor antagonist n=1 Tax=Actinocorallia longicatena TaxID=111803 RepID=A0ABP6Q6F8_9ACTN
MVKAEERLRLDHYEEEGVTVVSPAGEVDVFTAPVLREFLLGLLDDGMRKLVVDLTAVSFLDSTGLAVLVGIWQRLRNQDGSFALAAANPRIARVLRTTRLDQSLRLHETVREAIESA